ncbi:MAG: hypothetical protein WBF06_06235 [Candidatus Acidiferrales bacterium]
MRTLLLIAICALTAVAARAQATPATTKIYISNSNDWQKSGGFKTRTTTSADNAAPDSAHLNEVSAMASQCSSVEVTSDPSKASYILLWDTKAIWNELTSKTNLLIMYSPKGDAIYSIRSDTMDSAARHVCSYLATNGSKPAPKTGS